MIFSALTHMRLYRPGTTSFLIRQSGMNRSCSTSSLVSTNRTGVSAGTCSSGLTYPLGYMNDQFHIFPLTVISYACGGSTAIARNPRNP